jgi:hypothetical protein
VSILAFLFILLPFLPAEATAQPTRLMPRALYVTQPDPGVPGFSQHASSLELIFNNDGSRQALVHFLRDEYDRFGARYNAVYLMVETDLFATGSYRESLADLLRFLRKNGITRVEALYFPSDEALNYTGGTAAFAEAVMQYNEAFKGNDQRFDALHYFLMPNRYRSFRSFENRHSRGNQELFDRLIAELRQAREAAGDLPVAVTVDADSFFGVGETIVYSTGISFGVTMARLADRVSVMNYRDFSTGTRDTGHAERTGGLLLNIRPVLHILERENLRADMVVNAGPYRHPRYGNNSGFSRLPGYREGRSGRRDLNRQLRRTERYLSYAERGRLDHFAIFYYGAYLNMPN